MPDSNRITLVVDGVEVEAAEGQMLVDAAIASARETAPGPLDDEAGKVPPALKVTA